MVRDALGTKRLPARSIDARNADPGGPSFIAPGRAIEMIRAAEESNLGAVGAAGGTARARAAGQYLLVDSELGHGGARNKNEAIRAQLDDSLK
jgi:hypothetical protein